MLKLNRSHNEGISPGRIAWNKFSSNWVAMASLAWIVINILVATLGYLITPDSSPYANTQHLELSAKSPFSRVSFLNVRKNLPVEKSSFIRKLMYGVQNPYTEIPIKSFRHEDDLIIIEKYTGFEYIQGMEISFSMADIVFDIDSAGIASHNIMIYHRDQAPETISLETLRTMVLEEHIKTRIFWLGTDRFGRDLLSQIIIGARISLSVGFIAIAISLILGLLLGSLAGFYRGRVDSFIVWLINVVWSIPTLLLVIAITFALGKGFWQIFIAVGLTMWVDVARVVRGQVISLRENEYIEAAKALGLPALRIIRRHLLPNIVGPVVVISAANFASAILIEAGLSFLGIGVQPPMPSWGNMIRENYGFIILDKAFLALIPGVCIMLLVMAFMLVGNGLRDALDKSPANY